MSCNDKKHVLFTKQSKSIYPNIKFVSYTVDPVNDTPERFLEYIEEMRRKNVNIDLKNWDFLTGEKDDIYKLAMSYFANAKEDSIAPGGFLHSEYFILIDKEGKIRSGKDKFDNTIGAYDGTNEIHMKNLIDDVKVLMAEYKKPKRINEVKEDNITFLLCIISNLIHAQCAMCKAAVESNLDSGGLKGAGLNDGILFLMSMPYLAMLIFAIAFYYNKKTNNASRKVL